MTENEIAKTIVDVAYKVHVRLGPGLLESVYEVILAYELDRRGLRVERQVSIAICYDDLVVKDAFIADLFVEKKVIIELKATEKITPLYAKQLLTYLKLTDCRLGLLINFGSVLLRDGITRVANGLTE